MGFPQAGAVGGGGDEASGVATIDGERAGAGATSGTAVEPEEAMLAYAKCMRANGVDMPDPRPDGMIVMQPGSDQPDQETMEKADLACANEREALQGSVAAGADDFRDQALAMSRCMREQGVDLPDPTPSEGGGMSVTLDPDQLESPEFQRAQESCRKKVGFPRAGAVGAGGES